ncbi:sensor histidine kinase [Arthrobacter cupressi]|uniref:histidine kinase n=1 Tax=Arthrobacter cupressi TaxID=1045773 RepID=A0A1G8TI33_9MICC|nr:HAMP domain-containing sensor histidine kinase [Arthrobacter cupressi]NYD79732.1 signal transduction histidine kinase [Arthrobacter cupressi]SDJ41266.1 Signal transduction histidine kinase [Arthrobacter cupressi]
MSEQAILRTASRFFRKLRPRARLAVCELPLTIIVAGIVIAAPTVWPGLLQNPLFATGVVLHGLLFLSCLLVPWERLDPRASLVIPILDLLALCFTRNGAFNVVPGLTVLSVFPVIWLAASGMLAKTSLILGFAGPFLIALPVLLAHLPNPTASDISSVVLLPLMMFAVALSIRLAGSYARLQERRVKHRDSALRQLLSASRDREALLQTILDTIDVGIVAVDSKGETVLVNNQQKAFLGLTASTAGPPQAATESRLVFGQDRHTPLPPEKDPVLRAVRGETFSDYLLWFGEGTEQRAISTAARGMPNDADGGFGGAVVFFRDLTDVVNALAAKDELVANVSHEFGSPLTAILGNLDIVMRGAPELDAGSRRGLEVAERNAERLRVLVQDLLSSAASVESVQLRRTDLAGLVENSLGSARAQADAANVGLVADVPAPLWADADPLRLGQALDNLVSNAIKYSPDGGLVSVRASRDDGWVRLEVQDTGMGMTKEESARIFTRFFRTRAARQAAIPGAGLGLSITKSIVERHGGSITCDSSPGKGSTFTVALPAGLSGEQDPLPPVLT